MAEVGTKRLLRALLREEWRLHARLFGGHRFGAFPLVVVFLVGGATWLLVETGVTSRTLIGGVHALVLIMGLHTGTVGFVGRDALRAVLGDVTLLVFSARTLPLSHRRLLGLFVVGDVIFYTAFIITPIAIGLLPAVGNGIGPFGPGWGTLVLWITLVWTFLLGLGATLAGVGLSSYGLTGRAVLIGAAIAFLSGWVSSVNLIAYSPYGVLIEPSILSVLGAAFGLVVVGLVAAGTVSGGKRQSQTTVTSAFARWRRLTGSAVAGRSLLSVYRSAGGFGAVVFSGLILLGATVGLIELAGRVTGVAPAGGVALGTVLGLSGFTTYNWLTTGEDLPTYLSHPMTVSDVFRGTGRAFLLIGPPVGLGVHVLGVVWITARPIDAVVGAMLLVGVCLYTYGLTIYLTGRSPNEFLFDTVLFVGFGGATALALLPALVVAFALAPLGPQVLGGLIAWAIVLAVVGWWLAWRARSKWTYRYRYGTHGDGS